MRTKDMKWYLTVKEAAEILRVTPRTVRNWIRDKRLPVVRAGRRVLIAREEVDRFPRG
jgi:excisionase family DNA binding protein